ncbi:hypothetical protein ACGFXB_36900 [Streptomyces canus]|uniref:hypothetical protein n=1 Tax=Streptomyces canus TaxID=58343 RepID=UPI0037155D73
MTIRRLCATLRVPGKTELLLVILFGAGFAALPVLALLPSLWGFTAAWAVTYLADEALHVKAPGFVRRLATLQLSRASSNRVSKVYDEIWVAGRAGRDRYRRVRHAISDNAIVEVGRPQLAPVRPHTEHIAGPVPVSSTRPPGRAGATTTAPRP